MDVLKHPDFFAGNRQLQAVRALITNVEKNIKTDMMLVIFVEDFFFFAVDGVLVFRKYPSCSLIAIN